MSPGSQSLRVSCDRCRAKKLRCQPSSLENPNAPCQRCLTAKLPTLCVFSPRSGVGRLTRDESIVSEDSGARQSNLAGDKQLVFPGMSTFVLDGQNIGVSPSASPEMARQQLHSVARQPHDHCQPAQMDVDDSTIIPVGGHSQGQVSVGDVWNGIILSLLPSISSSLSAANPCADNLPDPLASVSPTGRISRIADFDTSDAFDVEELFGMPFPPHLDSAAESRVIRDQKPGAIVDLAELLAKVSRYEGMLQENLATDFDDLPIGEALFLSARFCEILSSYGHSPPIDDSSSPVHLRQDPTKLLLTLSCHLNLLRIYSSIFQHMGEHLSTLLDRNAGENHPNLAQAEPTDESGPKRSYARHFHALSGGSYGYRDLRLSQLRTVCLCATWDPVRKVTSILLDSLRDAEEILLLPAAVRIAGSLGTRPVVSSPGDENAPGLSQISVLDANAERPALFKEGLTNERMYTVVEKLANDVRGKVEKVKQLLEDPRHAHTSDSLQVLPAP